jgi:hypothetical protein
VRSESLPATIVISVFMTEQQRADAPRAALQPLQG